MAAPISMPEAGALFARKFRIEHMLGEGGFAFVFAATDIGVNRIVAVKILKPDAPSGYQPNTRRRVAREGRSLAQLRDPHTVRLFEHGEAGGLLYLVFEHVPGRDLRAVLEEHTTLNADVAEHILRQLLASLREAHRHGVVHRDIKPENIRIFERNGDPWAAKLLDFGIARDLEGGGPSLTATGELVGTPRYMSPEQLHAQPLTAASDIYSLGMVVFEMLLGTNALPGGSLQAQLDRLAGEFRPAGADRLVGPAVGVLAVASQMVSLAPSNRPGRAAQVLEQLDLGDRTTREQSRPAPGPPQERGRALWPLAALLAMLVVAALGGFLWMSDEKEPVEPVTRVVLPQPQQEARAPEPDAESTSKSGDAATADAAVAYLCGLNAPFTGRGTLIGGGLGPTWDAYVPTTYDPDTQHPLVVLVNEENLSPRDFIEHGGFIPIAEEHGVVLIAPDRPDEFWKNGGLPYLFEIQLETKRQLCVDNKRVYVVAQGDGARLAPELRCEDWVTAIVSSSWRRENADWMACEGRQKPVLALTSARSGVEPADGGRNCAGYGTYSIAELDFFFTKRNGCSKKVPEREEKPDGVCERWACDVPYERCRIDGGHRWPGIDYVRIDRSCDGPTHEFPSAATAWDFFERL